MLPYSRGFGGCCLLPRVLPFWLALRVRRVLATTVSSAGVALLSRVRRVLPTTEGAARLAGTEGSPGVGYYHVEDAGCWLLPCGGGERRRTLLRSSSKRRIIDWATTRDPAQQPGSTVPAPQAKGESLTGRRRVIQLNNRAVRCQRLKQKANH